jgi:hypothetical protein
MKSDAVSARAIWRLGAAAAVLLLVPFWAGAGDGLSSRMLIVPKAYTLAPGEIEFEPELISATYDHALDPDGDRIALDGRFRETEVDFRLTAGLSPRQELGALFGFATSTYSAHRQGTVDEAQSSVTDWSLGWKGRLLGESEDRPALALEAGIGFPIIADDSVAVWEAGLVYSQPLGAKWSLDMDTSYYLTSESEADDPQRGVLADFGISLDLADRWTLAAELNGNWERNWQGGEWWKVTPAVGFAYGVSDAFSITVLSQNDISGWGRNATFGSGAQVFFTFLFEPPSGTPAPAQAYLAHPQRLPAR